MPEDLSLAGDPDLLDETRFDLDVSGQLAIGEDQRDIFTKGQTL
jgi:hypothetical protein